jgi:hypothetical protein
VRMGEHTKTDKAISIQIQLEITALLDEEWNDSSLSDPESISTRTCTDPCIRDIHGSEKKTRATRSCMGVVAGHGGCKNPIRP